MPPYAVFVVDACRTPIGKVKGALAAVRPDDLTSQVIGALVRRTPGLDPQEIDDIYWGAANQAGEDNRNVARMGGLLAGLPVTVPGATVNRLCGSGLEAVASAARVIAAGEADACMAGGVESMTRAPFVIGRPSDRFPRHLDTFDTRLGWRFVNSRMQELYPPISMGETAENVAERYGVARDRQDAFALTSHRNAARAWSEGRFDAEITPIVSERANLAIDEGVQEEVTLGDLASRPPVFRVDGTVTSGNSSPLSDGAAGILLMSERMLQRLNLEPLARYVGAATAGVHPDFMGFGPVPSTEKLLARIGWRTSDLDLVELNEAFAAQTLAVMDALGLDPCQTNVNGGAIALGHPLGCSGARITTTLLHEMRRQHLRRGLTAMCIGVGQGISVAWEVA
jgi:acetyl-CoA acyltransferase